MQSLLHWGIANSDPNAAPPNPSQVQNVDPGIIDAILGKSDAERMKDALKIGVDASQSEDDRVQALDDFEQLVEQIDNANSE
jgi:hsp70-interacting protein